MPAMKCPACGHRNFRMTAACINCGSALAAPRVPEVHITEIEASSPDGRPPLALEKPRSERFPTSRLPATSSPHLPVERKKQSDVQPASYKQTVEHQNASLEPYMMSHSIRPPVPPTVFEGQGSYDRSRKETDRRTIVTEERWGKGLKSNYTDAEAAQERDEWHRDILPWWFPRRAPELAGTVIHVQSQQEERRHQDAMSLGALFRFIRDILWTMPGDVQQGQEQKEMVHVTIVRVRTPGGQQKETRIQGYFNRGNIALGDKVSIWGRRRDGVLLARRAYNHTAHAVVSTRAMSSSSLPFLFVTTLLIAGLVYLVITQKIHVPQLFDWLPGQP